MKKEKEMKKNVKSKPVKKNSKKNNVKEKKSLWTKFMTFCHGVGSETKKVVWPTKKDMVKYSVATIVFVVFCSLFFYAIEALFALVQSLFS